jgi:pimeloyl-ACP methyl ester carboxylesterase
METSLIYFPEREIRLTPANVGLAYDDLTLRTGDGVDINAWYIPCEGADRTLLWFHGNAGNMGDRVEQIRVYRDRWRVHQLVIDYRGYGRSDGDLSEEGTYEDARTAVKYLVEQRNVPPDRLVLFGRSLGAAVAVQMALEFDCAGLMLESPFASIREMAKVHYPVIGSLFPLRIRYESIAKIGRLRVPLLILHGDRDDIVPLNQGRKLYDAAPEPKQLFIVRDAGHNDILERADERYYQTVWDFLHRDSPGGAE